MNEKNCAQVLLDGDGYLIVCHRNPDGDTTGSAAALCRGLRKIGRRAYVRDCASFTPRQRAMLSDLVTEEEDGLLPVFVDVAAPDMLCDEARGLSAYMVIDHHIANRVECDQKLVEPDAAATGEIIFRLLAELGAELDEKIAKALYIAISTDTGCFRFDNTTSETHRIAAELLRYDFGLGAVNRMYFEEKTPAAMRLQGELLAGLRLMHADRIAAIYVGRELRAKLGITEDDLEDVSSLPRSIAGVEAGITFKELPDLSGWKVSLRTSTAVDAAEVCAIFGGGGHARAAGCTLYGTADAVTDQLAEAIINKLK